MVSLRKLLCGCTSNSESEEERDRAQCLLPHNRATETSRSYEPNANTQNQAAFYIKNNLSTRIPESNPRAGGDFASKKKNNSVAGNNSSTNNSKTHIDREIGNDTTGYSLTRTDQSDRPTEEDLFRDDELFFNVDKPPIEEQTNDPILSDNIRRVAGESERQKSPVTIDELTFEDVDGESASGARFLGECTKHWKEIGEIQKKIENLRSGNNSEEIETLNKEMQNKIETQNQYVRDYFTAI